MNVLIDTNILLDVIAERRPFYADSAIVWTLAEEGKITGLVSAISFTNIFYIVRRLRDLPTAKKSLVLLRDAFTVVPCDGQVINQAIDSEIPDFEDAVQYFSAVHAKAICIVSRNPGHFPNSDPPVMTPKEFLAAHTFE